MRIISLIKPGLLLGSFLLLLPVLKGQQRRPGFQVALPLGANLAQVAGDPYQGFRKWGWSAGVEGVAHLPGERQLSLGMFFQQLGAVPSIIERKQSEQNFIEVQLTYVEVPLIVHFSLGKKQVGSGLNLEIGASFARQLSSRVVRSTTLAGGQQSNLSYLEIVDWQQEFERFTWAGITGLSYYLHPQVALRLRYTHGIQAFFRPGPAATQLTDLRHRYLSTSVRYIIR